MTMWFGTLEVLELLLAIAVILQDPVQAVPPIVIKNYKMFDASGAYFGVRGVDYYPRPNAGPLDVNNKDLFSDDMQHVWQSHVDYIAALGANAVRLYAVDPSKSHDKFMGALSGRGIYALVDLGANCEGCSISKAKYPACYSPSLKTRGQMIINHFSKYDNVLAFSAGNEVNHVAAVVTDNAPCQKKFIRDMRSFMSSCGMRQIPIGVVVADTQREANVKYYTCRTDPGDTLENAQWIGINVYLHCDGSVTDVAKAAGFQNLLSEFRTFRMAVPVLLTEFGCVNAVTFPTVNGYSAQRTWLQAGWLHSPAFRDVFNGGFAFEFSTEKANSEGQSPWPFKSYGPQNYGLGYFAPENCDAQAVPCKYVPFPNYANLAKQYHSISNAGQPSMGAFSPDPSRLSPPTCPANFPALKTISWSAVDAVPNLACFAESSSGLVLPRSESPKQRATRLHSNSSRVKHHHPTSKSNVTQQEDFLATLVGASRPSVSAAPLTKTKDANDAQKVRTYEAEESG